MKTRRILLIVHNVRSAHNVGSILRTADGFGVDKVYLTGYSPYPAVRDDKRLPYVQLKADHSISKTALGAEKTVKFEHLDTPELLLTKLREKDYQVLALEQTAKAVQLPKFKSDKNLVLIVGNELQGLEPEILKIAHAHLEIPMSGAKESFNVSAAAAVALYHLRFLA